MSVLDAPHAPPPEVDDHLGGGSGWVLLTRCPNDIDAHLLTGRLADAGIETRSMTDRSTTPSWLFAGSNPWAPVVVMVRRIQYEDARLVLAEIAWEGPVATPVPERPHRGARRALVWWAIALMLGIFFTGVSLANASRDITCANPLCLGQVSR